MFKLMTLISNIINAGHSSSFLSATFILTWIKNLWSKCLNFLLQILWTVCKLVFGVMEAFEYMIKKFLGIGATIYDVAEFGEGVILNSGPYSGLSYVDFLFDIFRAILAAAIILLIVFTIIAIIKQEWQTANEGFEGKKNKSPNDKTGIIMRSFRGILAMFALPLTMMLIIGGFNAILTSFNNAIAYESDVTIAGQVLATSTYDANKYRTYANANQRVPIVITAYNSKDIKPDELTAMSYKIKDVDIQNKLKKTATNLVNNENLTFKESLVYKNNKFYNSDRYEEYYEQFIATAEQYQVMADFVDYAQKRGINYYIKSMDEDDIEWKYVNSAVYDKNENALNITYTDASDFDNDGSTSDTYTMTLAPENEVTSPLSDAIDSIMAMLGIKGLDKEKDYSKNVYNVMERDDSGDFLNLVQWANEKALIHFSEGFDIEDKADWTDTDEIIVYEFYHFASNNTFGAHSLKDFEVERNAATGMLEGGVELDVSKIEYREYYEYADAYSDVITLYCVQINGSYYKVEPSTDFTDNYGNTYYVLSSLNNWQTANKNVHFIAPDYKVLTKVMNGTTQKTTTLTLSADFDINNKSTWTISDQILVYEYYKDLSISNDFSKYGFGNFYPSTPAASKIKFPVYEINDVKANVTEENVVQSFTQNKNYYVLINGTYYQLTKDGTEYYLPTTTANAQPFLGEPGYANSTYYNYAIEVATDGSNGFNSTTLQNPGAEGFLHTPVSVDSVFTEVSSSDPNFFKYENFTPQLSSTFDYTDETTWSYRDYFIFYLYVNYEGLSNSIDALKNIGLKGKIGTIDGYYCFQTESKVEIGGVTRPLYIKLDTAVLISELNVSSRLKGLETLENQDVDTIDENLFVTFDEEYNSRLMLTELESVVYKFSSDYIQNNVSTWTVLDFILSYFSSNGIINPIDEIEANGYQSLVYTVNRTVDTETVKDKLYRFGRRYNSGVPEKTILLSEYNVLNYLKDKDGDSLVYESLDKWLNKNMMDFICEYNKINTSNILSTYSELTQNLFTDYDSYIYDYSLLAETLVEDNYIQESVRTLPTFTYTNPSFVKTDLSTWTEFDLVRYYVTGNVSASHTSSVISSGSNLYVNIGNDKYVKVNDGKFKMDIDNNSTITSSEADIASGMTIGDYVTSSLSHLVKTRGELTKLQLLSSMSFEYTSSNQNLTSSSTYSAGALKDLDALIAYYNGSVSALHDYHYYVYFDSNSVSYFLKLNENTFIDLSYEGYSEHYVSYQESAVMELDPGASGADKLFTVATTYNAFDSYYPENISKLSQVNLMDAIVYGITGKIEQKAYTVYQKDASNKYIIFEHNRSLKIVKFTAGSSGLDYDYDLPTNIDAEAKANAMVDYLYNTYYSSLYSDKVSNVELDTSSDTIIDTSGGGEKRLRFISNFDLYNPKTWDPLNIILYKLKQLNEENIAREVTGSIYRSMDGKKRYLGLQYNVSGSIERAYIEITNIVEEYDDRGEYREFRSVENAVIQMYMRLYLTFNVNSTKRFDSSEEALANYQNINTAVLKNLYDHPTSATSQHLVNEDTIYTSITANANVASPTTWSWLDLLHYYYNGEARTENKYLIYLTIDEAGTYRRHLLVKNPKSEINLYVYKESGESDSNLEKKFTGQTTDDKEDINYTEGSFKILDMIYYKITGKKTGKIDKYFFVSKTGTTGSFYYIQNTYNSQYYGIYNIPASADEIKFKVLGTAGLYITPPTTVDDDTPYGKQFLYFTPNAANVYTWNIFDFIVNYASADSAANSYASYIYEYNSTKYFVVDNFYINLTSLSDYVEFDESDGLTGEIEIKADVKPLMDIIGIADVDEDTDDREIPFVTYVSLSDGEKTIIDGVDADRINNLSPDIYPQEMKFSANFDANNFETWTVSDLVIYYAFMNQFYTVDPDKFDSSFDVTIPYEYLVGDSYVTTYIEYNFSTLNFQSFINQGFAPGFVYSLMKEDSYGNVKTYKVVNLGNSIEQSQKIYFNYDVFLELYTRKMINPITESTGEIDLKLLSNVDTTVEEGVFKFTYIVRPTEKVVDFAYDNYYFFNFDGEAFKEFNLYGVDENLIYDINEEAAYIYGVINLKLSDGFELEDPDSWTLLDTIVMYEYSRSSLSLSFTDSGPNANLFYNMKFSELLDVNNYVSLYTNDDVTKILALNGNYYNLTDYLEQKNPGVLNFLNNCIIPALSETVAGSLTEHLKTKLNEYDFSLYGTCSFGEYLKSELSSYTDSTVEGVNVVHELLLKFKDMCTNFILNATASTDDESIALAEYLLRIMNLNAEDTDITKELFQGTCLKANLESYRDTIQSQSEYVLKKVPTVADPNVLETLYTNNYISDGSGGFKTIISEGSVGSYTFKTLVETIDFAINRLNGISRTLNTSANTISYVLSADENVRYYRSIYENTKDAYQVNLSTIEPYTISKLVRQVSWPQKLMNDMQVLYPDLNWSTLIATDGWLDTLGNFTSAYTNGMFESKGNSANTTAAGLVLSEFFLSQANEVQSSYAQFEYKSLFDEDVIKSLMLSLLGEQEYHDLSKQAEIFMSMFNNSFAAILEDIAYENSIEILDGQVSNFVMCVYKSYLATVLLSSDIGEYLYTVATRIYAQYTIYESLACASGDYANYYAYVNDYVGENGEPVNAFNFSSFYELVKYENELSGNSTPMYTFSMYNAYKYYEETENNNDDEDDIRDKFEDKTSTEAGYYALYSTLFEYIDEKYDYAFNPKKGGSKIPDNSPIYCFMFETYWGIYYELDESLFGDRNTPFYLDIYRDYLEGDLKRWSLLRDDNIDESVYYMSKYDDYTMALAIEKISAVIKILGLSIEKSYDDTSDMEAFEAFLSKLDKSDDEATDSPIGIMESSFGQKYRQKLASISDVKAWDLYELFKASEQGSLSAWNQIVTLTEDLPLLIEELYAIIDLSVDDNPSNNRTIYGSQKIYRDFIYQDVIDKLENLYMSLSNYKATQGILDQITKASITFTLGQYGQNYVSTGFNFNIENRNYTFNSGASAQRLAEYVYGGSYLLPFGIEPVYVDEDFDGIISQSKAYDAKAGHMKISLEMWPQLREFAGELANYTAKLYYTTNLNDLAKNNPDDILLTDYIFAEATGSGTVSGTNGSKTKTTLEYKILEYLITEESISPDTFIRLLYGNGDDLTHLNSLSLGGLSINQTNLKNLAQMLHGANVTLTEDQKKAAILDYLVVVQSENYTSGYYNPTGATSRSDRIHRMFKNVVNYLLVSEDQSESIGENAINLDNISFKQFKILLMDKIIDYEQNPSETALENASRYIAIFNLITTQFTYRELNFTGNTMGVEESYIIGSSVKAVDMDVYEAPASGADESQILKDGAKLYIRKSNTTFIYADYGVDNSTKDNILKLAGLSNRPIEELVNLEYDSLYDRNGCYDEAKGDVFILCSYDDEIGKYVPILARGQSTPLSAYPVGSNYYNWYNKYGLDITSSYLNNADSFVEEIDGTPSSIATAYPIIAKGVISSSGLPTAIQIQDGVLGFYRTDVLATSYIDDDAVNATAGVSEVNTVGYTSFVESSSHKKASGQNKKTMFIGSYDMKTYLNSGADIYFMQNDLMYVLAPSDDFGALNVLDQFSAFYLMGGQTYILLLIGISTMLPLLFNATAAVLRRVLDLIFLTLAGPLVISMRSMDTKDDDKKAAGFKAFNTWKSYVEKTILAALGYVIAFNVYYILAQTVLQLSFVSDLTMSRIAHIGGVGFITKPLLESIFKYVYLIGAAAVVKTSASLLLGIITAGKVTNPFAPAVGSDLKKKKEPEVMESVKGIVQEGINAANKVSDIVTGQALLDLKAAAIEGLKSAVPGSGIVESAVEMAQDHGSKKKAKELQQLAEARGVPKAQAQMAANSLYQSELTQRKTEKATRVQQANNFMSQYLGDFGFTAQEGEHSAFKTVPTILDGIKDGLGFGPKKPKPKKNKKP